MSSIPLTAVMLATVVFSLLGLVLLRFWWRRWKYDLHKIPSPPGLPILGHTLVFLANKGETEQSQFVGNWWKNNGFPRVIKLTIGGINLLCVRDVDAVKNVIMSTRDPFPKTSATTKDIHIVLGNDPNAKCCLLTNTPTPYVKAIRRVYASCFQSVNLKKAIPRMQHVVMKMLKVIEKKRKEGPIDFQELCTRFALDTIGNVLFEYNLGGLDGSGDVYELLIDVGHIFRSCGLNPLKSYAIQHFPKSSFVKKDVAMINKLTWKWERLVEDIVQREDPSGDEQPLWYQLKSVKDPETNKPITRVSLIHEMATAVVGGSDSTGHQLSWLLALLASHPEVVNKLLEQMREQGLYGPGSRDVSFEDLTELTYLCAIVKEGMRIASAGVGTFVRKVPRDMTLVGYSVPKGTAIFVPSNRNMDSVEEWGDPETFRPERWLEDPEIGSKYYFPFSVGPRDCPGQKLAIVEMRYAIFHLIRRYEFSTTVPLERLLKNTKIGIVIEAIDGVYLNVTLRE